MSLSHDLHVVTGAFGFSGMYLARRLLDAGCRVRTLTTSPDRANPLRDRVEERPLDFAQPDRLAESLRGAKVLYNTYWVRFNRATFQHATAVENTRTLFRAAQAAGVGRVVHVSITNPSEESPLEYFRGKAQLERALAESGLSHAILRPAVLFGREDILINNIAWCLRTFPVFPVFGDGNYRLQPIYVDDLAQLALEQGQAGENRIIDAVGPETFTYRELATTIGRLIGKSRPVIGVPPWLGYLGGTVLGWMMRDVMITREEIRGLMDDLLYTGSPPAGPTRLTDWVHQHADSVGGHYASELARRRDRQRPYLKFQ